MLAADILTQKPKLSGPRSGSFTPQEREYSRREKTKEKNKKEKQKKSFVGNERQKRKKHKKENSK